ncbi:MAG: LysR family transcriptional regulator [Hyphomonadaceae bacterium]
MRNLQQIDLNLLVALDLLLEEENVTQAARRYGRSVPAMSRILMRLREAIGDPLLVRVGRRLAPTARAKLLKNDLGRFIADARALLDPPSFEPAALTRDFVLQCNEDFVSSLGLPILKAIQAQSPGVSVRFAPEGREGEDALRTGRIDLELSSGSAANRALVNEELFRERYVAVARRGHPIFQRPIDAAAVASYPHVVRSRLADPHQTIDEALARHGLSRRVIMVVPSMRSALTIAAGSDLIAAGPSTLVAGLARQLPVRAFELPLQIPQITIRQSWHPRFQSDVEHQWFRGVVGGILRSQVPEDAAEKPIPTAEPPPLRRRVRRAAGARAGM